MKRPMSPPQPPVPSRKDSSLSQNSLGYSNDSFGYPEIEEEPEKMLRKETFERTSYSEAELKAEYDTILETVMTTLGITEKNTARLLLSRIPPPWNIEKAAKAWFDDDIQSRLLGKQCRVQDDTSVSCLSCWEPCQPGEVIRCLSCSNTLCADCATVFLRKQLSQRSFPPYTCKQLGGCECDGVLDGALISSSEATLEGVVKPFRKCPAGTCGKMNRPVTYRQVNVRCDCGAHYCFACGQETHFPVPCQYAFMWLTNYILPMTDALAQSRARRARMSSRNKLCELRRATRLLMKDIRDIRNQEHGHGHHGRHPELDEDENDASRVYESLYDRRHSPPESEHAAAGRLPLTAAELLAAVPLGVQRELHVLGFTEAVAAEIARTQQPNDDEGAVGGAQHEARGDTGMDAMGAAGTAEAAPVEEAAEATVLLDPVQAAPLDPPVPPEPAAKVALQEPPDPGQATIPELAEPDPAVGTPNHHKLCPGCLQAVKLEGLGCNSTQCPSCGTRFCYICLGTECEVVRSHGVCPQGGIDVAAFLAAVTTRNAAAAAATAADITALASYQPDAQEMKRLKRAQHRGWGPRNLEEYIDRLPPAQSPLECLLRALVRIGVPTRDFPNLFVLFYEEETGRLEHRQQSMRVAVDFMAKSLNLNDENLIPGLERTHVAWKDIRARLQKLANIGEGLPDDLSQVIRMVQEALRLEQWLLVDEWLSDTGRVRSQNVNMIAARRQTMNSLTLKLSAQLHEVAEKRGNGTSTDATPMIWDLHRSLEKDLRDLLQRLHAAFGAGAAMNKR